MVPCVSMTEMPCCSENFGNRVSRSHRISSARRSLDFVVRKLGGRHVAKLPRKTRFASVSPGDEECFVRICEMSDDRECETAGSTATMVQALADQISIAVNRTMIHLI